MSLTPARLALIVVPAAILLSATVSALQGPSADVAAVTAVENDWLAHEHDRAALERIIADDFVHAASAGVFLTKPQHIDWAVSHPAPPDQRRRFDQLRVRVYGATAIATGIVIATRTDGSEERTIFTDVFVKRAGKWEAVSAQETPSAR